MRGIVTMNRSRRTKVVDRVANCHDANAMGLLGLYSPWLMKTGVFHYEFAVVMLAGLWFLRTGFTGRASGPAA